MQAGNKEAVIPIPLGRASAFLVTGSRYILVGCGTPGSAPKILKQLSARGIEPGRISLLIITQGHRFSTGDLQILKEKTGAPVVAHQGEIELLRRGAKPHLKPTGLIGRLMRPLVRNNKSERPVEADIVVNKELDLKPYGIKGKVISTPGYTPGSLSVVLAGGEAIIGDLLTGGLILRRKLRYPLFANDLKRLERSIRMILKLKPSILYTALGGPLKPEDVVRIMKRREGSLPSK